VTAAGSILIRPAHDTDRDAIWALIGPVIRGGTTYALNRDLTREDALDYWLGSDRHSFVAQAEDDQIIGTYYLRANQAGGGNHICNCGYMVASDSQSRGVARALAHHSFAFGRQLGFVAMQFNFVIASNTRAVKLWLDLGFAIVGRVPGAFMHPDLGPVDALIMHRTL